MLLARCRWNKKKIEKEMLYKLIIIFLYESFARITIKVPFLIRRIMFYIRFLSQSNPKRASWYWAVVVTWRDVVCLFTTFILFYVFQLLNKSFERRFFWFKKVIDKHDWHNSISSPHAALRCNQLTFIKWTFKFPSW